MTTIKTLPWGISPAKHSSGNIILDGCCFDETKHPIFHDEYEDIKDYCLPKTIGVDTEFVYSVMCYCPIEDGDPPFSEVGIGRLALEDDVYTLEREQTLFTGNSEIGRIPHLSHGVKEIFHENGFSTFFFRKKYENSILDKSTHIKTPLKLLTIWGGNINTDEKNSLVKRDPNPEQF